MKRLGKRVLAAALGGAMLLTSVPVAAVRADMDAGRPKGGAG